jgi:uncharacterized membrane protein
MKKHSRTLILVLAAIGLAASLTSLWVHYRLLTDPSYTSFCDVSATVNCEAVYQSAYGSIGGVPIAAGGAIWAGLVLLLALGMRGTPAAASRDAGLAGYVFVLSTLGLAAVLYYAYASFFVLGTLCLLCLTMYVAVIGAFIVSGAAAAPVGTLPGRAASDLRAMGSSPVALGLAAVWLLGSVAVVAAFPREESASTPVAAADEAPAAQLEQITADERAQFEAWLSAQPREQMDVPADGAKVVVVKFNDYQCPACRQTYIAYKGLKAKWEAQAPRDVRFVSVDYPLEAECNSGGIHGAACEAAAAVRMARTRNRAEAMEEWLFDNQARLTRDVVEEGVREVAQVTDFDDQYPKTLEAVRADAQLGQRLQITGTPTFYINGIKIGGGLRPAYFDAAIEYELKRAQGSSTTTN